VSTLPDTFSSSADDSRLELAMAAARSERRNRPRLLIVVALLILIVAAINLLWTFTQRAAAATSLSRARASLANVDGIVAELERLAEKRASPKYNAEIDLEGKLGRFAEDPRIGLPKIEVNVRSTSSNLKGFKEMVYQAVVPESDPQLLLRWVTESLAAFPGVEIKSLRMTPGRTLENGTVAWTLDISFRRWERTP
jgi:hypothetical protein